MDPAELSGVGELLRPQRPADEYIGVSNFFRHTLIILELDKFMAGKILLQAFAYPWGCVPEFKAVVVDDECFHGKQLAISKWQLAKSIVLKRNNDKKRIRAKAQFIRLGRHD